MVVLWSSEGILKFGLPDWTMVACGVAYLLSGTVLELRPLGAQRCGSVRPSRGLGWKMHLLRGETLDLGVSDQAMGVSGAAHPHEGNFLGASVG